jgi:hypothetical protein
MKISKTRLKEIIKEELSGLGESGPEMTPGDRDWANNPANTSRPADADSAAGYPNNLAALADVAGRLGASPDASAQFASEASAAIVVATSTPESTGGPPAMTDMLAALVNLALSMEEPALEEAPQTPSSPNPLSRRSRAADNRERNRKREADPRRAGVEAAYEKNLEKAKEERRRRGIEQ